ncbi:alpha/beta fold hydrolase [Acetobacterium paludosum]|uniref:Alpha/beta fold hydrolase n=2 Tax=Acetobacterium paludosum TaxID=52693 RepID=A0A923KXC3_9FIRM|nr:alpha/beta fold hydrolase [Acetobacterium paludosum]
MTIQLKIGGILMSLFRAYTPSFKDMKGRELKNSITEMSMVIIGNTKESIIIRGENRNNPVLLLLHGGPGSSETSLFRYYNSPLEKKFVVVYWDQRACGKSYTKRTATEPLSVSMFVADICELTQYLKARFSKNKIFLLGHSWGTLIGTLAVLQHPELFCAYIGTGQVSSMPASELKSYQFTLNVAVEQHNRKAIRELKEIGKSRNGIYKCGVTGTRTQRKWLAYFGGAIYGSKNLSAFIMKIFTVKEYNITDIIRFFKAMNAPSRNSMSQNEFLKIDLFETVKSLDVPVCFFLGKNDFQVSSIVAEKYFHYLKAPKKKLVWFEKSAHSPCFEESEKFNKLMIDMVLSENRL